MKRNLKTKTMTLLLTLMSAAGLQAASLGCCYQPCEPVCCQPETDHWTLSGDYLYWRALNNGLVGDCDWNLKDRWSSGYRLGLGYDSACLGWKFGAVYTHFYNNPEHGGHYGDFVKWQLKYNTLDLLAGTTVQSSACFSYTPYGGLRGAWIEDKLRGKLADGCPCDNGSFGAFDNTGTVRHHHKQKFYALGPLIGVKGDYSLGCGFSFYGWLDVGILYGHFDVRIFDEDFFDSEREASLCVRQTIRACQAFADVAFGIQWEQCLCNNLVAILRAGVEHHRYFNQNTVGSYADLCLDGVTVSAGLRY